MNKSRLFFYFFCQTDFKTDSRVEAHWTCFVLPHAGPVGPVGPAGPVGDRCNKQAEQIWDQ